MFTDGPGRDSGGVIDLVRNNRGDVKDVNDSFRHEHIHIMADDACICKCGYVGDPEDHQDHKPELVKSNRKEEKAIMKIYRAIKKFAKKVCGAAVGAVAVSGTALATTPTIDMSGVDLPTDSIIPWFLVIAGGLAIMWGIRKMTKTTNRT